MKLLSHFALLSFVALAETIVLADSYTENTTVSGDEIVLAVGETQDFDVNAGVTVTVSRVISGEGAVLDLDELVAGAYPFSPRYGDHLVLQTTDGITGTPVLDRDSAAYQAGWRCGVKNGAVYVMRHMGTSLYFR